MSHPDLKHMYHEVKDGKPAIYATTRKDWRKFLSANKNGEGVWLILFHKTSTTESVDRIEATEEALCFGWIDSLCKGRDEESYYLTFSPRKKNAKWSAPNIERAQRMIRQRKMTKAGLDAWRRRTVG